jgi:hypothetical protein
MALFNLKPTHAPVKKYYATLQRFAVSVRSFHLDRLL